MIAGAVPREGRTVDMSRAGKCYWMETRPELSVLCWVKEEAASSASEPAENPWNRSKGHAACSGELVLLC